MGQRTVRRQERPLRGGDRSADHEHREQRPQPCRHESEIDEDRDRDRDQRRAALGQDRELGENGGDRHRCATHERRHLSPHRRIRRGPRSEDVERARRVGVPGRRVEPPVDEETTRIASVSCARDLDHADRSDPNGERREQGNDACSSPRDHGEQGVHDQVQEGAVRAFPRSALRVAPGDRRRTPGGEPGQERDRDQRRGRDTAAGRRVGRQHDGEEPEQEEGTRIPGRGCEACVLRSPHDEDADGEGSDEERWAGSFAQRRPRRALCHLARTSSAKTSSTSASNDAGSSPSILA